MSTKNLTPVLKTSFVLLAILVLLGIVMPDGYQVWSEQLREVISDKLGWFYLLLVTSIVLLCGFFLVSPVGQIKLGEPNSVPEHSTISWIAMIFSAGMGIGLVFYGAAEPLSHYAISTVRATPGSQEALADAFRYTFFHWGIHAWAIYALIALALAYFGFRKKEKYLLSVTLKPLFGKKTNGSLGKIVDTITVVATVIGVATTLGFGAAQINGGLNYLFGIPNNALVQVIIIIITTILFTISALSGLGKGVKILSNTNLILAVGLLAITIIIGPTVQIFNTLTDSIGLYISNFFRMSFSAGSFGQYNRDWINTWTIFYWAWWISWSPFVGVFIARISKGRSIRQFLSIVFASVVAIILIITFFITSADSATYVLAMLSDDGNLKPKNNLKIFWGVLLATIAIVLLLSGGLVALQNTLIIVAFPFSLIMVLIMVSLVIELLHEKDKMGLSITPTRYPKKDQPFKSYEE